jgi:hypothetical protein
MRIIDNNAITHVLKNNIKLTEVYYLAPDVSDEAEIAEQILGGKIPDKIRHISKEPFFDENAYIRAYKEMLNKHTSSRSFYNMTGFGDISILALVSTMSQQFSKQQKKLFNDMEEEIVIFTEDAGLRKKISQEFKGAQSVTIRVLDNLSLS